MCRLEKIDFLFRYVANDVRQHIQMDDEALFSTTDQVTADKITNDLLKFAPSSSTITDATACVGGNTYSFAQVYHKVCAIEKDVVRYKMLKHNMHVLGVSANVSCIHGDSLDVCRGQRQDVVFIDPPWGGPEYKRYTQIDLHMIPHALSEFCEKIAPFTKFIAIKAPTNFNEEKFVDDTRSFMEMVHRNTQLRKMHLYIFRVL